VPPSSTDAPNGHVDPWLAEHVLGLLPAAQTAQVEMHLKTCSRCAHEADRLHEDLALLPLALPPAAPPAGLRGRLLAVAARTPQEGSALSRFTERLARLFDWGLAQAEDLLRRIPDAAAWTAGPCAGSALLHVQGGPLVAGADAGVVRLQPGVTFPHHTHRGDEIGIVLQGAYRDSDGQEYRAGESVFLPAGSDHAFTALPGEDLLIAVVVHGGVTFTDPALSLY
jgi:putative transcriptional regulator